MVQWFERKEAEALRETLHQMRNFFRKGDMVLLVLCLATSAFDCLILSSVTNAEKFGSSTRYIVIQLGATALGILAYVIMSSIDTDFFSEHRISLTAFSLGMLLLLIPFGTDNNTGNWSWLDFPFLPFMIQPAEIVKIFFILILASVMGSHQNKPSGIFSVAHVVIYLGIIAGANMAISSDLGVTLIFVFIFAGMVFAGGVNMLWIGGGIGAVVVSFPLWWPMLDNHQRNRIMYLFDPTIDPEGLGVRWHTNESLKSLTGGGLTGQGLFNGNRTQGGQLFAQHTDFVFSSIGEELGFIGCMLVVLMMVAIIARCIWVGTRSPDYMRKMVCYGAAAALIFQVISNIGMCIGVTPVIGLTLPLISYGGSSVVTIYAMLGLVSGVYARPAPRSHERYIRIPR